MILPYAIGSIIATGAGVALAAKAGRTLLVTGALTVAASQGLLWWLVSDGATPGYWPLAGVMFLGGLGLGLGAPILVNVVLAGVPGRPAGAAGGVLSTVNQIGGAIGTAILATVFFNALPAAAETGTEAQVFGRALAQVMPWQAATYLLAHSRCSPCRRPQRHTKADRLSGATERHPCSGSMEVSPRRWLASVR